MGGENRRSVLSLNQSKQKLSARSGPIHPKAMIGKAVLILPFLGCAFLCCNHPPPSLSSRVHPKRFSCPPSPTSMCIERHNLSLLPYLSKDKGQAAGTVSLSYWCHGSNQVSKFSLNQYLSLTKLITAWEDDTTTRRSLIPILPSKRASAPRGTKAPHKRLRSRHAMYTPLEIIPQTI